MRDLPVQAILQIVYNKVQLASEILEHLRRRRFASWRESSIAHLPQSRRCVIALRKLFAKQLGSAHLICFEVEIDLAMLIDLAAGHRVIFKLEGYDSLNVC